MTVGTGIFLAAVVIALLVLFLNTRERWNWKTISKWGGLVLVGLPIVISLVAFSLDWWNKRPRRVDTFWDVTLGQSEGDVKFAKGEPTLTSKYGWIYYVGSDELAKATFTKDSVSLPIYVLKFARHRLVRVTYITDNDFDLPDLNGVVGSEPVIDLLDRFGNPSHVSRSKDERSRIYSFDRYQVFYEYQQSRIQTEGIFDPTVDHPSYVDEAKD